MAQLDKKNVLKVIINSAKLYKNNLVDKNFLIVSKTNNTPYKFWELKFEKKQFAHLTGVKLNISSTYFYKKAISRSLSIKDFEPRSDGSTELKLEVLPKLMEFKDSIRMIGDYDDCSPKLYTEVLAGNLQGALGFVTDEKSDLVPNTCLKCNTKLRSKPERIVLMLSKKFYENEYCNIEYIAEKNFDINELKSIDNEFKDEINKLFSNTDDLVAVECDT